MRVLYIHQYFVEPKGSGGTRSYEFARRLVDDGHHVTMLTSTAFLTSDRLTGARVERFTVDGIDVVAHRVPYTNALSPARRTVAFLRFAVATTWSVLLMRSIDVVFATSTPLTVGIPGLVGRVRHRARFVFEVRDLWPAVPIEMGYLRSPLVRHAALLLERLLYRSASEVIALSPGMADGVRNVAPSSNVTVVPNASDRSRFAAAADNDVSAATERWLPYALYAGTFGAANDVAWIVDVAEVMPTGLDFVLIGAGAQRGEIVERARQRGLLGSRIHVLDPVPKSEVTWAFLNATVVLSLFADFPLLTTTSPNKFFDALAAGRPIAINYEGWQADLLRSTGAGIVLTRDPRVAAATLHEFVQSPARLDAAGAAARELGTTEFDRDVLYDRWRRVVIG